MTQSSPLLTAPIGRTIIRLAAPNMLSMVVTMATLMAGLVFFVREVFIATASLRSRHIRQGGI